MSNDNLYGHRDRRRPVEGSEIRVKDAIQAVYAGANLMLIKRSGDPDSQYEFESQSFERGLRALDTADREMIEYLAARLQRRIGKGCGKGTALQIIAKLGVFFLLCGYKGQVARGQK